MNTTTTMNGVDAVTSIKNELEKAGLPRTSRYSGGEITGWTTSYGCTGFSIRKQEDGRLFWHVVISGKPHLRYREYRSDDDTLHEPTNTEILYERIRAVFEAKDANVHSVEYAGHQTMWDDDVSYGVVTDHPGWLEASPPPAPRTPGRQPFR